VLRRYLRFEVSLNEHGTSNDNMAKSCAQHTFVGCLLGALVGSAVGLFAGDLVGSLVGPFVGRSVGFFVGDSVETVQLLKFMAFSRE
jgi:uncharacterized protein YqgC (DUF456 family)